MPHFLIVVHLLHDPQDALSRKTAFAGRGVTPLPFRLGKERSAPMWRVPWDGYETLTGLVTRFLVRSSRLHTIGGARLPPCQESLIIRAKQRVAKAELWARHRIEGAGFRHPLGARSAGIAGAVRPIGVDVKRLGCTFDHF